MDGSWSTWSSWKNHGQCSATCGVGELQHVRTRNCNNPLASNGGKECVGNKTEIISMSCSTKPCPPKSSCKKFNMDMNMYQEKKRSFKVVLPSLKRTAIYMLEKVTCNQKYTGRLN